MIYSRFGTKLTPVSKEQDESGRISIQVKAEGVADLRTYATADLQADNGMTEINDAIAKLPWRTAPVKTQPRDRNIR
jgi:hypothetical protein